MRFYHTPLAVVLVAFLASSCAHGARWRTADLQSMAFDGESPSQVRVITASDTVPMAHPIVRGDSLVGKYGHGEAVAFESIEVLQEYRTGSTGFGMGGAILLAVLGAVIAIGVLMAISLEDCCL